jgi:hypothetical protein
MKFSRIGRRLWRRPRPKLGCGAREGEGERGFFLYETVAFLLLHKNAKQDSFHFLIFLSLINDYVSFITSNEK